jgi:hypothetical protein
MDYDPDFWEPVKNSAHFGMIAGASMLTYYIFKDDQALNGNYLQCMVYLDRIGVATEFGAIFGYIASGIVGRVLGARAAQDITAIIEPISSSTQSHHRQDQGTG